jgi:hypothetical protein
MPSANGPYLRRNKGCVHDVRGHASNGVLGGIHAEIVARDFELGPATRNRTQPQGARCTLGSVTTEGGEDIHTHKHTQGASKEQGTHPPRVVPEADPGGKSSGRRVEGSMDTTEVTVGGR